MTDRREYELNISDDESEIVIKNESGKVTMSKGAFVELFVEAWQRRIVTDNNFSKAEDEVQAS